MPVSVRALPRSARLPPRGDSVESVVNAASSADTWRWVGWEPIQTAFPALADPPFPGFATCACRLRVDHRRSRHPDSPASPRDVPAPRPRRRLDLVIRALKAAVSVYAAFPFSSCWWSRCASARACRFWAAVIPRQPTPRGRRIAAAASRRSSAAMYHWCRSGFGVPLVSSGGGTLAESGCSARVVRGLLPLISITGGKSQVSKPVVRIE